MENTAPTKTNLINLKNSLQFSQNGFELLDKKRNTLIKEMMAYVEISKEIQKNFADVFEEACNSIKVAKISYGLLNLEDISNSIPKISDYTINYRSVMGVQVPSIAFHKENIKPSYGIFTSEAAVDDVYDKFTELKYLLFKYAEVENAVFKLSVEVKKTQKRANALQNVQIPKLKALVKYISDVLEEKDREDFFRLKVVKNKKSAGKWINLLKNIFKNYIITLWNMFAI